MENLKFKLKRMFGSILFVLMLASFPFSVVADDDFEDIEQYNEIDFESDTNSEVSEEEVTPEVTPAESDLEEQQHENDENPSEVTPEVTPAESDLEEQQHENDENPSEVTPEVTPESTPEPTQEPDNTISELIETVNHNFDSLHSDNIHLMVVVCIGIGSIIGFLLISKILP